MSTNESETIVNGSDPKLNKWFSIWFNPRATVRQSLSNPYTSMLMILIFGSIILGLNTAAGNFLGDEYSFGMVLLIAASSGIIFGFVFVYVFGALLGWIGRKLLGGEGSYRDVTIALAHVLILFVFGYIGWIPSLLIFGHENFTTETPLINSSSQLHFLYFVLTFPLYVISIWALFTACLCLAEAHQFPVWKAILTVMIVGFGSFLFIRAIVSTLIYIL